MKTLRLALVGDHDPDVVAHRAIPLALEMAARELGVDAQPGWLGTDGIQDGRGLLGYDAVWCVPASPYRSMAGALEAIRVARTRAIPFLGTCGGFQHAVIEYARNVLDWSDADHAETATDPSRRQVVTPLACSLVEVTDDVRIVPGSRLHTAYGVDRVAGGYHCSYGLNPEFRAALTTGPLRVTATDAAGDVRAVELDDHPFFVATLFQPERAALSGVTPQPAVALLRAAMLRRA